MGFHVIEKRYRLRAIRTVPRKSHVVSRHLGGQPLRSIARCTGRIEQDAGGHAQIVHPDAIGALFLIRNLAVNEFHQSANLQKDFRL